MCAPPASPRQRAGAWLNLELVYKAPPPYSPTPLSHGARRSGPAVHSPGDSVRACSAQPAGPPATRSRAWCGAGRGVLGALRLGCWWLSAACWVVRPCRWRRAAALCGARVCGAWCGGMTHLVCCNYYGRAHGVRGVCGAGPACAVVCCTVWGGGPGVGFEMPTQVVGEPAPSTQHPPTCVWCVPLVYVVACSATPPHMHTTLTLVPPASVMPRSGGMAMVPPTQPYSLCARSMCARRAQVLDRRCVGGELCTALSATAGLSVWRIGNDQEVAMQRASCGHAPSHYYVCVRPASSCAAGRRALASVRACGALTVLWLQPFTPPRYRPTAVRPPTLAGCVAQPSCVPHTRGGFAAASGGDYRSGGWAVVVCGRGRVWG